MKQYIFANDYYFIANTKVTASDKIKVFDNADDWVNAIKKRFHDEDFKVDDFVETAIVITETPDEFTSVCDNGQWVDEQSSPKTETPTIEDFILQYSL